MGYGQVWSVGRSGGVTTLVAGRRGRSGARHGEDGSATLGLGVMAGGAPSARAGRSMRDWVIAMAGKAEAAATERNLARKGKD